MRFIRVLFFICLFFNSTLFGAYTFINGTWAPDKYTPTRPVQEHFDIGLQFYNRQNWNDALDQFMVVAYHFRDTPFYTDSVFYCGACYFYKGELDLANKQFDLYLEQSGKLKHFEKTFEFKYEIAELFAAGQKKHLLGVERLPKWAPGGKDALILYDEIIAALPGQEIAAKALFGKGEFLHSVRNFKDSIEALKTLQRFFPKHPLCAESYVKIGDIYLEQSILVAQNPDYISLAQLNLTRFYKNFPMETRLNHVEEKIAAMKEVYAQSLYDTGRFYERKNKPKASMIYYNDAIQKYPGTFAAQKSQDRLAYLNQKSNKFRELHAS